MSESGQAGEVLVRRGLRIRAAIGAVVVAAVLGPSAVLATHLFTDVPDTHPFNSQISWMAATGITTGCTGTKYCPNDPVTRAQMAVFMQRLYNTHAGLLGSHYASDWVFPPANGTFMEVASATVTVPPGTQAQLVINFSAQSGCVGGTAVIEAMWEAFPRCLVEVRVDGVPVNADEPYYLDTSNGGTYVLAELESKALVRFTEPLGPGLKTVTVHAKPYECSSCAGYEPPQMALGSRVVTVQAMPLAAS